MLLQKDNVEEHRCCFDPYDPTSINENVIFA